MDVNILNNKPIRSTIISDFDRPAVPAWMGWFVIGIVCIQMALNFSRHTIIFKAYDVTKYMSLLNYILFTCLCIFASGRFRVLLRDKYFTLFLLFLINGAFVDCVIASTQYQQPLLGILRTIFRFGGLLVFPILYLTMDERMFRRLIKALVILGCFGAFFSIVLKCIPSLAESIVQEGRIKERFGRIRLPILFDSMVYFIFFYSLVKMVKFKNIAWGAMWAVLFYVICFIGMTRQIILSFTGTMLFFFAFRFRIRESLVIFTILLFLLGVTLVVSPDAVDLFDNTIDSVINSSSEGHRNIAVRKDAVAFYWEQLQKTHYLGFGRISTVHGGTNPILAEISRGAGGGGLVTTDIGLIGSFCQYGFGLLLIVIAAYYYAFSDIRRVISRCSQRDYAVLAAIELLLIAEILRLGPFFSFEFCAFYGSLWLFIVAYYSKLYKVQEEYEKIALCNCTVPY